MCHCLLLHWIKKLFYGFCLVDSSGDMAGCMSGMLSCCLSYNADSSVQYKRRCEKLVWLSGLEPGLRIKRLLLNPGFSTTFILYDNWYTPPPHPTPFVWDPLLEYQPQNSVSNKVQNKISGAPQNQIPDSRFWFSWLLPDMQNMYWEVCFSWGGSSEWRNFWCSDGVV